MNLTQAQLQVLKTSITNNSDSTFASYRTNGQNTLMAAWYNVASTFIVFKTSEQILRVGEVVNYIAVEALTDIKKNQLSLFYTMNPVTFVPSRQDQRDYLSSTFSGALGGQGAATLAALEALYRRPALRGEQLYCVGTGTTVAPGALHATAFGEITDINIQEAVELP